MPRRQSPPEQWLITDPRVAADLPRLAARLPVGTGLVLRDHLTIAQRRRLRLQARSRGLRMINEGAGGAARVHNAREIRRARLQGARLLLLSPMFETRSHPGRPALPRMRAAALARLAGRPLLALGGMDPRRFARVRALGFDGWAGIDAWVRRSA